MQFAFAHDVHMAKREKTRQFLRAWRKAHGHTLTRIAEEVGMTHQNLGKIERGEVPYSDHLLEQLAAFYGTDKGSLLVDDPSTADPIRQVWRTLTPKQKKEALDIIEVIRRQA